MKRNFLWVLPTLALLAACSGIPVKEPDATLERYLQYAGEPIDRFSYLGRYNSWTAVGRYQLVVFTTTTEAYLITVSPPCEELEYARRIGLTETANTVSSRFDAVKVGNRRCTITEIRPIDYRTMRQDMRRERAEQTG